MSYLFFFYWVNELFIFLLLSEWVIYFSFIEWMSYLIFFYWVNELFNFLLLSEWVIYFSFIEWMRYLIFFYWVNELFIFLLFIVSSALEINYHLKCEMPSSVVKDYIPPREEEEVDRNSWLPKMVEIMLFFKYVDNMDTI
jgi:hypothetical protein